MASAGREEREVWRTIKGALRKIVLPATIAGGLVLAQKGAASPEKAPGQQPPAGKKAEAGEQTLSFGRGKALVGSEKIIPNKESIQNLVDSIKFTETKIAGDTSKIEPWTDSDREALKTYTFITVSQLLQDKVDWQTIVDVVGSTEIVKTNNSLSFASPGRIEIGIDKGGLPDYEAVYHEWGHLFLPVDREGIDESFAEYFRRSVKGEVMPEPEKAFRGCGQATGSFDYLEGYYGFGRIVGKLYQPGKPHIIAASVDIYKQWVAETHSRWGDPIPVDNYYKGLSRAYDRDFFDIVSLFESEPALKCGT